MEEKLINKFHAILDFYYEQNPDTLMPLLLLVLARKEKLFIDSENKIKGTLFYSLSPLKLEKYEWIKNNRDFKNRIKKAIENNVESLSVVAQIPDSLKGIYDIFYKYDNFTVVREYHHRIGRLVNHSRNKEENHFLRIFSAFCLAEALLEIPQAYLDDQFLFIADQILFKSGLQPQRPRLQVAEILDALLNYRHDGIVYNPFAGCAIAAAALKAGDYLYADGDQNDKIFAAGRLINYGMGGSNIHFEKRNSEEWLPLKDIKYVLCTYRGYVEGKAAFDFCLSKCFDTISSDGRFAGIIAPKDIFEKQSPEFKEMLKRDWLDTIVLLPFGEVAVLANAKKERQYKGKVRFFNLNHPFTKNLPISSVLLGNHYVESFSIKDLRKKDFLKDHIIPEIDVREGFKIVKLGELVEKIKRYTYSLENICDFNKVMVYIDHNKPYNEYARPWMNGLNKKKIHYLLTPASRLDSDSLIVNDKGALEPRLFDAEKGRAFFQNGYAFRIKDSENLDVKWLIRELNKPYVERQLHPYGFDRLIPQTYSEDQVLNLKLYKEEEIESQDSKDDDKLPENFILEGNDIEYTIQRFLGNGFFGYAYVAESHNLFTGEVKKVVLKEFFPHRYLKRKGDKVMVKDNDYSNEVEEFRQNFFEEAHLMKKLGSIEKSFIVPALETFHSDDTDTDYYVMPFYKNGSLEDLQESGYTFTEEMVTKHILEPLCRALHVSHCERVLHLDIKPENILVDDNGDAMLIDFGVARQYDSEGALINFDGVKSTSPFAAPELKHGNMVKFGRQPDIFGLASSIFHLMAFPDFPKPIYEYSSYEEDMCNKLRNVKCTPDFINALLSGLYATPSKRPKDSIEFLRLFPGYKDFKLR